MREIKAEAVTAAVRQLCITANKVLPEDLVQCIGCARQTEPNSTAKSILGDLENNLAAAKELDLPICQDTGMAVVFAEIGQDVHIDGDFEAAVHAGVSAGYTDGLLRKSVVRDPFFDRVNTGENMSDLRMFTPAATRQDLVDYIVGVVQKAGSNPCPPVVIGVGIGGDFEKCALLAKEALCRPLSRRNPNPDYAALEQELLEKINALDIGPQGFGGQTTALGVNIETYATHIAGLPVAVNVGCHVTRHATK